MASVFNSPTKSATLLRTDKAKVSVSGGSKNMIALGVTVSFQRAVEIIPVIGEERLISVGIPQGQCTIQSLLCKDGNVLSQIMAKDGKDDCSGFDMSLDMSNDKCLGGTKKVTMHGCVASAVSIEAQGGRGYVASGVTITFTGLEV